MPILENGKHEDFCLAIVEGQSVEDAYVSAGYAPNRGNATRLKANEVIRLRIEELQGKKAKALNSSYRWDASELFERQVMLIQAALAAGKIKEALDGNQFILKCLGYEDGPTLTHEHLRNQKLTPAQEEESVGTGVKKAGESMASSLSQLLKAHAKISKVK